MKEIYKIMKDYAYNDMCACGNCGADFYFGGCCEGRKCPICGYGSEDDHNFQECCMMDFLEYVVESIQQFDNNHIKFTMYGKTVTIDFESSTMICEDESGKVESCHVDEWVIIVLYEVYEFWESCKGGE